MLLIYSFMNILETLVQSLLDQLRTLRDQVRSTFPKDMPPKKVGDPQKAFVFHSTVSSYEKKVAGWKAHSSSVCSQF